MILGPLPILTVTIESGSGDQPEVHIHPGGQGVWAARMAIALGANVELCCALGGESGQVLEVLIERWGATPRAVQMQSASNAVYIHDRRGGERLPIATESEPKPKRHEIDSLYTAALVCGMRADVALLTGTGDPSLLGESFYRRLAHDLAQNGTKIVTDLVGEQLEGVLASGIELVKISEHHLLELGYATDASPQELVEALLALREAGARNVVVSRRELPVLALLDGHVVEAIGPRLAVADPRGTGDSQSAAMAVALARGASLKQAVRLGMAAGAMNATRMGLGSGDAVAINEHAARIQIREGHNGTPPTGDGHRLHAPSDAVRRSAS
jgi:1-phosphofructokinase